MVILNTTPSYTVTTTGNLDTSNVGSTVTYTYTASSDIVGNPGASVNRTVTVIDYDPISVTNLAVSSNNAVNDSYAKAGDTITISFTADSSDITSVSGILLGNNEFDASINGTRNDWVCSVCKYRMECASDKIYSRSNSIYKYACRKNILCYKQSYTLIVCKSYCKFGIIFYWVRWDS